MNPNNLNDFDMWQIASETAKFVNKYPQNFHRINTPIVDDTEDLLKLEKSKDVAALAITAFASKIYRRPPCPYLRKYLNSILKEDVKIYLSIREISRIWDIPKEHLKLFDFAKLESIQFQKETGYLWEDVKRFLS